MAIDVREVSAEHAADASALVHASFGDLVAPDWEQSAQQTFLDDSAVAPLAAKIEAASYAAAAFHHHEMVGFVLMPSPALLGMLFVRPDWVRKGVARALWEQARAHVEAFHPTVKTVELNATPYALPFYRSVGFVSISAEFQLRGCRATRMACWLPARALGAECSLATPSSGHAGAGAHVEP